MVLEDAHHRGGIGAGPVMCFPFVVTLNGLMQIDIMDRRAVVRVVSPSDEL